jgi:hypothetical protein
MYGQYIRNIDRQLSSEEDTFLWLSKGDLKAETECEIVATQDQALETKYYATKILNTETDSKCRPCQHFDETIDHIISTCPILAKEQYIKRHYSVCTTTLQHIQGNRGTIGQKHRYEHVSKSAETSQGNHIVESTSTNRQNYPQQQTKHYNP